MYLAFLQKWLIISQNSSNILCRPHLETTVKVFFWLDWTCLKSFAWSGMTSKKTSTQHFEVWENKMSLLACEDGQQIVPLFLSDGKKDVRARWAWMRDVYSGWRPPTFAGPTCTAPQTHSITKRGYCSAKPLSLFYFLIFHIHKNLFTSAKMVYWLLIAELQAGDLSSR